MNDEQLREIAKRHAREAVAPIGSRGHERLQAANGLPGAEAILQNIRRQEEVIFYALKEASEHSKSGDAQDALRWRWWRANGMRVEAESPDDWTCWVGLPCITFRSKTEDPDELTDALIARFPLQPHKPGTDWPDVYDHCGKCGEIVEKEDAASHKCTSENSN